MARWQIQGFASYLDGDCELRAHENRTIKFTMVNGQLVENQTASSSGLSARTRKDGAWGFASVPDISGTAAEKVIQQSRQNAAILARRVSAQGHALMQAQAKGDRVLLTPQTDLSNDDLLAFLKEVEAKILAKYPDVKSRRIVLTQQDYEKELITTSGANCFSWMGRSYIYIVLGMESPHGPVDVVRILGGRGHFNKTMPEARAELDHALEESYWHLKNKSAGTAPQAGTHNVILDSRLAGILAHEAIGHTVEADIVLGGSVAGEYLGREVASPLVNLVDFAHTALGKDCPLPVYFDDEGVEARDTNIIENGVLKNYMHSRETAAHFGHQATGHSRAFAFNDEPLIRMRNTAILPGQSKLDEMIASIDDGYYLMETGNGQADTSSEFMFAVTTGYEIKKGKLGRALLDTTISGVAFDMLKTVTAVSDEMTWVSSGFCGKKQPMSVGMGGPSIKCRVNIGGK